MTDTTSTTGMSLKLSTVILLPSSKLWSVPTRNSEKLSADPHHLLSNTSALIGMIRWLTVWIVAYLNCGITVFVDIFNLKNRTRSCFNNGYRNKIVIGIVDLGHPKFFLIFLDSYFKRQAGLILCNLL